MITKNTVISQFFFFVLLYMAILLHPTSAYAITKVVCPSPGAGCDYAVADQQNNGDAIQQAVNDAPVGTSSDKTVIHIKTGDYRRQSFTEYINSLNKKRKYFLLTKEKYLILEGQNGSNLDGTNSVNMSGVYIRGGAVEIKNLEISGFKRDDENCLNNDTVNFCSTGHGIILTAASQGTIRNNLILNNHSSGIAFEDGDPLVTSLVINNTIVGNDQSSAYDQINFYRRANVEIRNNIIANGKQYGIGKYTTRDEYLHIGTLMLVNNDVWGNTAGNYIGILDQTSQNGNISADPKFISATDFHLQSDSPARNAGTGDDPDGTNTDMGAYGGAGACGLDPNLPGCVLPTNTPTPPLEQFSVKSQDITSSSPSKTLYYPLVLRNWPSGNAGSSQWSHIILSNPSAETANVTITIWGATTYDTIQAGSELKGYSISIPPHGTYSSYSDDNWKNLPDTYSQEGDQTIGALSISSNVAISGINRWQMRKGNTFDGMPEQVFDTPLIANPSSSLHSPLAVRNWPSGKEGYTQWSDIMLFNPNSDAIDVAFTVFHATEEKNGLLLKRFNKTIPGHGWLNTYGMDEWKNLEVSNPAAEIKAAVSITGPINKPFVGISRWKLVQGKDIQSNPTVSTIDTPLLSPENKLFYPLALRNWPSGNAGLTQWTDLILYNPNNEAVSVQIKVTENNPQPGTSPKLINTTIPAHGYYGTYGTDWLTITGQTVNPERTNANVSITESGIYGIVGIARWRLVTGDTVTGTLQSLSDTPLMGESKVNEVAFPLIARGIPTGMNGNNLWNDIAIFNPSDSPNKVLFKLYSSRDNDIFENGSTLRVFEYTIPPYDYLNTYSLGQWHALPTNNADPVFSQSSLVVESESPVYAIERMRYLDTAPSNNCQKKPLGDADCNNEIEPTDYEEWEEEFGLTTKATIADFNNNGKINLDDFEIWRSNL